MANQSLTWRYAGAILEIGLEESTDNAAQIFYIIKSLEVLLEGWIVLTKNLLPSPDTNDKMAVLEKFIQTPLHNHVKLHSNPLKKNQMVYITILLAHTKDCLTNIRNFRHCNNRNCTHWRESGDSNHSGKRCPDTDWKIAGRIPNRWNHWWCYCSSRKQGIRCQCKNQT